MLTRISCLVLLVIAAAPTRSQIVPVITSTGAVPFTGPGLIEMAELHDIDGDGLRDLVMRTELPLQFATQHNLGGGAFGAPKYASTIAEDVIDETFTDVDGDGVLDVVLGNPPGDNVNLCVLLGDAAGGFALWVAMNNGSLNSPPVAVGDVDGDGDADIVSPTLLQLAANLQAGSGFTFAKLSAVAEPVGEPILADFDVDGDLDVAQASDSLDLDQAETTLRLSLGDGEGGFSNVQVMSLDVRVQRTQTVHLNADGLPDLLVFGLPGTSSGEGGLYLLENQGGTLQLGQHDSLDALGALTRDACGADLNGDGCSELIIVRDSTNEIRMNDSDFDFPVVVPFSGPVDAAFGLADDVDGDQLADVVVLEIPAGPTETWNFWHNATTVPPTWTDLGQGLAGVSGVPQLGAQGLLFALQPFELALSGAAPGALAALVVSGTAIDVPFKGGTFVPAPDFIFWLVTPPTGALDITATWPNGLPAGTQVVMQAWIPDAQGPQGFAASNALLGVVH